MGRILIAVLRSSLIIERVTEKILDMVPARKKTLFAWLTSSGLGLLMSFVFRFGLMKELGLSGISAIAGWLAHLVTGIMLAAAGEPILSLLDALAAEKEELRKRVKSV